MEALLFIGIFLLLYLFPWIFSFNRSRGSEEQRKIFLKYFFIVLSISGATVFILVSSAEGGEFSGLAFFFSLILGLCISIFLSLIGGVMTWNRLIKGITTKNPDLLDDI